MRSSLQLDNCLDRWQDNARGNAYAPSFRRRRMSSRPWAPHTKSFPSGPAFPSNSSIDGLIGCGVTSPIAVEDIRMLARLRAPMLRAKQAGGELWRGGWWWFWTRGFPPVAKDHRGKVTFSTFDERRLTPQMAREHGRRIAGRSIFLLLPLPPPLWVLRSEVRIRVVQGESDDGACASTAGVGDANKRWELVEI